MLYVVRVQCEIKILTHILNVVLVSGHLVMHFMLVRYKHADPTAISI